MPNATFVPARRRLGIAAVLLLSTLAGPAVFAEGSPPVHELVGHWRYTRVLFDTATDTHLVLHADGRAESWRVSTDGRTASEHGRWQAIGQQLALTDGTGRLYPQPYTIHAGKLVFPNIPNRREFWEWLGR